MRPHYLRLLLPLALCLLFSCDDCNDCLDTQQKDILVQDAAGNNLLFGENAIFNPEDVTISSASEASQPLFINLDTQTLQFSLNEAETIYTLRLDENTTDILVFELGERESDRCCGNQIFSTATELNGEATDNSSTILIIN